MADLSTLIYHAALSSSQQPGRGARGRSLLALVVPTGLVVAGGIAGMSTRSNLDRGPVYDIAVVRTHLAHAAKDWVGRPLLVRGWLVPCEAIPTEGDGPCADLVPEPRRATDAAPAAAALTDALPLTREAANPLLARIWRIPILGDMLPAPQVLRWGAVATYRVRLRAVANSICGTTPCYEAVLLDVAPAAPGEG
jgi:hypothetical protein